MKKIYLGADHGGFELKEKIKDYLAENFAKFKVIDLGCDSPESVDYPIYGKKVAGRVAKDEKNLGIVVCGSGVGISIAANKVAGVRCVLVNTVELAKLGREHNGVQVLALGGRTQFFNPWEEIVSAFLTTKIDKSERHERRRCQLDQLTVNN